MKAVFASSEERRLAVADAVNRADGNLLRAAHILGVRRMTVYRWIREDYLWPIVNRIRKRRYQRRETNLVEQARKCLRRSVRRAEG